MLGLYPVSSAPISGDPQFIIGEGIDVDYEIILNTADSLSFDLAVQSARGIDLNVLSSKSIDLEVETSAAIDLNIQTAKEINIG